MDANQSREVLSYYISNGLMTVSLGIAVYGVYQVSKAIKEKASRTQEIDELMLVLSETLPTDRDDLIKAFNTLKPMTQTILGGSRKDTSEGLVRKIEAALEPIIRAELTQAVGDVSLDGSQITLKDLSPTYRAMHSR